jgi:hypothetical protein
VFYNNSLFDGRSSSIDSRDDAATATDKQALLPMQAATFANVTSFSRGINGLFIDVRNLPATAAALDPADFAFKTGLTGDPTMWPDAPVPTSVTVRRGAGVNGSDRVTLAWPDGAIKNRWLRVQVLASSRTGLTSPDVFYFGHLAGETGNAAGNATGGFAVNAADLRATRSRLFSRNAPITSRYDFNRDGRVNSLDLLTVRLNRLAALPAFTAPHDMGGMVMSAALSPATAAVLASDFVGPAVPTTPQPPPSYRTQSIFCACCITAHDLLTA